MFLLEKGVPRRILHSFRSQSRQLQMQPRALDPTEPSNSASSHRQSNVSDRFHDNQRNQRQRLRSSLFDHTGSDSRFLRNFIVAGVRFQSLG